MFLNFNLFQVMDDGKVIEFNAPYLLLQNSASFLSKLVEQTGKAEALHLMEIAKAAFNKEELPVPLPDGNITIVENPGAEKDDVIDDNVKVIDDNIKLNGLDKNINADIVTDDVRTQKAEEIVKTALENALNEISGQEKAELERNEKENQEKEDQGKENQEMTEFKSEGKNEEKINELTEDQGDETEETALLAKDEKESREKDGMKEAADKSSDSSSNSSDSESETEETALIDKSGGVGANQKSD